MQRKMNKDHHCKNTRHVMKRRSSSSLSRLLPELAVSHADQDMLRGLASSLVTHNLGQSNTLLVTKEGFPDSSQGHWKEMRRKDNLRIYRERATSNNDEAPFTPSLLLLGTVEGTVEDVMYGVVATTDAAMKIKSTCVHDGLLDCRILFELAEASVDDPFRHVGITWRLYSGRDYVSLDSTGILNTSDRGRIGYNLSHSVGFAEIPSFKTHGVVRGNMSVCSLYRQKTPTTVECYVRGFFGFPTKNEVLNSLALQTLASQWLSFGRKIECGRMKKLAWKVQKNSFEMEHSASSSSTSSSSESLPSPKAQPIQPLPSTRPGACALCFHSFGFLGTNRETCNSCRKAVCPRCISKKRVCVAAPDGRTVLRKKRAFCRRCVEDTTKSDTLAIAREELTYESED